MKRTVRAAIAACVMGTVLIVTGGTADAAVWSSTDRWGSRTSGSYTLYNGNVQFGFEITSSADGKDFVANSYSVTA